MPQPTGLAITNPLVLYRALIATNRISSDPAQHRLALHLQKLYERLIDYEPRTQYSQRLKSISQALKQVDGPPVLPDTFKIGRRGVWASLLTQKEKRDSLALTRVLTNHEEAMQLDSPKGLMLHGEVGTGKSMLIDLFADCLPNKKKRRWHYNSFMLEVFAKLEHLRRNPPLVSHAGDDYSLIWLAKDLIESSPILFLDEFQLPDRTAAKIVSNLMTSFFQLGGVLIATSNRMPDELAKAAGIEFTCPPSHLESPGWRFGRRGDPGRGPNMFAGQGEYANFLAVLRSRCDVWEMEAGRDYRRDEGVVPSREELSEAKEDALQQATGSYPPTLSDTASDEPSDTGATTSKTPKFYFVRPATREDTTPEKAWLKAFNTVTMQPEGAVSDIAWKPTTMRVYGRNVHIPRTSNGVASLTFTELCGAQLGPADYITLASTFHTIILTDVPILTVLLKNEARRFITLLDALYEARCKLLISAATGPDDLFFPETRQRSNHSADASNRKDTTQHHDDGVYPETFSEIYQDATAPFRPNISSYAGNSNSPDYTHSRLQGVLADDALEDQPPHRLWSRSDSSEFADRQHLESERFEVRRTPDFAQTGAFTGEDERFAYKRAASRLWEMCGSKWWDRQEEGWWRPVPREDRLWERHAEAEGAVSNVADKTLPLGPGEGLVGSRDVTEIEDEIMFRHEASPFRTAVEPPPKIGWTHVWGTTKWGKRSGVWGQGVEGLKDRKKEEK
jgi:peroxisome-assembly ATPase